MQFHENLQSLLESSVRESASSRTKEEAAHHKLRGILKEITEVKSKIHHALRQGQDQILAADKGGKSFMTWCQTQPDMVSTHLVAVRDSVNEHKQKVEDLKARVSDLPGHWGYKSELAQIISNARHANNDLKARVTNLKKAEEEYGVAAKESLELSHQAEEVEHQLLRREKQLNTLIDECTKRQRRGEELGKVRNGLKDEVSMKTATLAEIKERVDKQQMELEGLQKELEDMSHALQEKALALGLPEGSSITTETLNSLIKELEEQLDSRKANLAVSQEECANVENEIESCHKQHGTLSDHIARTTEELKEISVEIEGIQKQKDEVLSAAKELETLKQKLKEAESRLESHNEAEEEGMQIRKRLTTNIANTRQGLEGLKVEISDQETALKAWQSKIETALNERLMDLEQKTKEVEAQEASAKQLQASIITAQEDVKRKEDVVAQKSKSKAEKAQAKAKQREELAMRRTSLDEELKSLAKELRELNKNNGVTEKTLKTKEKQAEKEASEITKLTQLIKTEETEQTAWLDKAHKALSSTKMPSELTSTDAILALLQDIHQLEQG